MKTKKMKIRRNPVSGSSAVVRKMKKTTKIPPMTMTTTMKKTTKNLGSAFSAAAVEKAMRKMKKTMKKMMRTMRKTKRMMTK